MLEWANEIKKKGIKKAYIIYGEEEYIRQKALSTLIGALNLQLPDLNHTYLDSRAKAADIVTACETLPMMDEKRLVHIKNFEPLFAKAEDTKILEDYIEKILPTTVLLFDTAGKVDKRRRLYKIIDKHGQVKDFSKPPLQKILGIVCEEAEQRGMKFSKELALALIEQCGQDLYTLTQELEKLVNYSGSGLITKEVIRNVASKSLEYDVFSLHGLFMEGNAAQALLLLNQVLEEEKSAFGVIGLIAYKFRLVLKARVMMDARYPEKEILSHMGTSPNIAKEAVKDARKFNSDEIRDALKALSQLDYSLKSGQGGRFMTETALLALYKLIKKPSTAGKLNANLE